jgi:hypothetical protein
MWDLRHFITLQASVACKGIALLILLLLLLLAVSCLCCFCVLLVSRICRETCGNKMLCLFYTNFLQTGQESLKENTVRQQWRKHRFSRGAIIFVTNKEQMDSPARQRTYTSAVGRQNYEVRWDYCGASTIFPGSVSARLFHFPLPIHFLTKRRFACAEDVTAQRARTLTGVSEMISSNVFETVNNVEESASLPKGSIN